MIIEWLDKYYFLLGTFLMLIAVVKLLGTAPFLRQEDGMAGMIVLLFRWFTSTDHHVCDAPWQIKTMRAMNVVSLLFYIALIAFLIITVLIKLFR